MKAILVKSAGHYDTAHVPPKQLWRWIWYCRICDRQGRVYRTDWRYIAWLGMSHLRNNHPPMEPGEDVS